MQTFSYKDELFLRDSVKNLSKRKDSSQDLAVHKEVIKYIAKRVPSKSVYEKLVFFLKRSQMVFIIDDFGEQAYFFRESAGRHDIRYFDIVSKKDGLPVYNIHITRCYFYTELKDNIQAQASLLLEFYAEKVLVSPRKGTRHEFAREKAKALADPSRRGIYLDEQRQSQLDDAVKAANQKYLFGLIECYDIRQDPDRIYIQAIYAAISNLDEVDISTGNDLLAWYRYMLEGDIRETENWAADEIIPGISKLIREAVTEGGTKSGGTKIKIKKTLIYKDESVAIYEENLLEYNRKFVFPYRRADYCQGRIIFMPQCRIELNENMFRQEFLDVSKDKDSLAAFAKAIEKRALEENALTHDLQTGLRHFDGIMAARKIICAAKKIVVQRRSAGDKRAAVIGVLAPAGAGKTTISEVLSFGSKAMGLNTAYVGCDAYLQPGAGFRYDYDANKKDAYRHIHIWGPGIYNDVKTGRVLDHLKQGGALDKDADVHAGKQAEKTGPDLDVIVSDGVFIGIDKDLLAIIDILVCLYIDDDTEATRLELKWSRDTAKNSTHKGIHLPLDFAEKQFHETKDGMKALIPERADFVWVREKRALYIRRSSDAALS